MMILSLPSFTSTSDVGAFFLSMMNLSSHVPQSVVRTWARHVEWLLLVSFSATGWRMTVMVTSFEDDPPAMT
jgi:hypothetical protein